VVLNDSLKLLDGLFGRLSERAARNGAPRCRSSRCTLCVTKFSNCAVCGWSIDATEVSGCPISCWGVVCRRFSDRDVPSRVTARSLGRYASIATGIDNIKSVESLTKPASTFINLAGIGRSIIQSAKRSVESSPNLIFSSIRMLKSNLVYSGTRDIELMVEEGEGNWLKGSELLSGVEGSSDKSFSIEDALVDSVGVAVTCCEPNG
jgi:hypothetical protein